MAATSALIIEHDPNRIILAVASHPTKNLIIFPGVQDDVNSGFVIGGNTGILSFTLENIGSAVRGPWFASMPGGADTIQVVDTLFYDEMEEDE